MIGTTLAHYRITAALGAGGMGEVWRAEDTKLGRDVALKVLSEEFADDAERLERFEREARAVAALNHPHIVTIYSVEEAGGTRFLTMELIEGRSLDKMIPEGGLDLAGFFALATPLAEAISAAHDKSIIHRDLKPSNVMVDGDGRVKVLDFGLAKQQGSGEVSNSSELATEALTGVGMIVGTVPYMSPEQIEGKIVDHRTDIFSLGVLLYEMATGDRPFQGDSQPALMSSILKDVPQSVLEMRDDLPRHLGRIIGRCLEKDRRDRYQTARDVFNELKALRRESSASIHARPSVTSSSQRAPRPVTSSSEIRRSDVPWIAVLPFGYASGDPDVEAFADGLEEDIATGLSRFSYLFVVARKSTRRYRGEATDVRQVGEELGARYVMEAGIRRAGARIRISMNLIDAATGTHLWSETYDRDLDMADVFELQDEITGKIVATVADSYGILVHSIEASLQAKTESEYAPWEWLIRLFGYRQRPTPAQHTKLRDSLEEAVDRDPNLADVWACLSQIYLDEHGFGFNVRPDAPNRALSAAQRAVDIDRANQLGYQVLAQSQFFRHDLKAFRSAADRAMSLNPRDSNSIGILGLLIVLSGEFEHGADIARRAMELNPNHAGWYHFGPIWESFHNRDYEKALEHAKQVNMPGMFGQHLVVAAACGHLGRHAEAEAAVNDLLANDPDLASSICQNIEIWHFASGLVEPLMEGLEKAGLKVAPGDDAPVSAVARSGARKVLGIAVLPFSDLSPAKDQDYFCEGMAEEIMNALVHVDGIQVASRTSAFKAFEEGGDLRSVGRTLNVGQILEGSVRMSGDRLRVTAQLTEVDSGYQVWSERYDREVEDVFAIQDEIAAGVVEAVTSRLAPGERKVREREKVGNVEAYRHYLKGRHYRYSKNDHGNALKCYERAVALDPSHAPSWVAIAESKMLGAMYNLVAPSQAVEEARSALATAEASQGENAEALYVQGQIAYAERNWVEAERVLQRAGELEPDHVRALCWLAVLLSTLRRGDEALLALERARDVDPLAAYPYNMTAACLLMVGDAAAAIDFAEQAAPFGEANTLTLWCTGISAVALGQMNEAVTALEEAAELGPGSGYLLGLFGWALAVAGRTDDALAVLDELRARPEGAPTVVPEGWLLAALGSNDEAWAVLEKAADEHQLVVTFTEYPGYDPLRSDPRFPGFVERLGLPPSPSCERTESAADADTSSEKSIAVLPFVNMSADPENEYFSDGLSEEIINALTRLPGLRVIARTSAFRFRGEQDLRKVGEALGVETLLEGSVRKAGEKLRITAQLVDVADDSHIWSERFDRAMTDVFEIQDEIAGAIVKRLNVSLAATEPARRQTANVAAYDALLEGRHHWFQFTPAGAKRALACFQRALSLDPEYPDALAFYAFYHLTMAYMFENPREMLPKTREFAEKALQLDPNHGEAQAAVAVVEVMLDRDWSAGELLFRRALELAPASARVHELYGLCWLLGRGRFDEALAELDLAIKLDPLSALYAGNRGRVLTCTRRFAEAEESCRRGLELDSRQLLVQVELTYALLFDGRVEEAIAVGKRAIETHGPVNAPRQALSLSYALAGRRDEAFELVNETAESAAGYRSPLALGLVYAAFSEMDEAFACVEQSLEERDPLLIYINVHPMFDTLRADPRFAALVERVGLPPSPGGPTAAMDSGPSQHVEKSIVVLPFDNLSPDPDTEYFSDGLTDEIITDLSGVRALRVISRSSAMRLKGDKRGLAAISRDLDCRYVLEGSVRRAADTLRITARLVDAPNDDQLWADKYGGTLDDVFDIQERVSRSIVDALEIQLTPQEAQQLSERPIPDVRARECYLLARREIWSFLPGSLERAISHLEAGISLIGDNALLYQGLGEAYFQSINIGAAGGREEEYIEKAESYTEKIFALEPESPGGYSVRAHLQLARGDIHGCGRSWRRVLQAFPKDVQALQLSAHILGWLAGKPDAAMPLVARLLDIDPLDPMSRLASVTVPLFAGRFEEALEPGRRMFDLDPVTPVWRSNYVMALSYNQRLDEAEALTEGVVAEPDSDIGTWWMGLWRAAWREDRAEVLRLADGPYQQAAAWDAEIPWVLASAHAAVGATEEALLWLDRAIDRGMINYPFLSEHDRYLDSIRGDKRFGQAMEKARREWERFDV